MLTYQFMDARTFYRIIFVGNEPYKNHRNELNSLKHEMHQLGAKLQEDHYWNMLMLEDLFKSIGYYVRKFISGVFRILILKLS